MKESTYKEIEKVLLLELNEAKESGYCWLDARYIWQFFKSKYQLDIIEEAMIRFCKKNPDKLYFRNYKNILTFYIK